MFNRRFGRGRGFGRGFGSGFGPGYGAGFGTGRGACYVHYQQTGQWPAWSRWAGGPGYQRYMAAQEFTEAPVANDEIAQLRQQVQSLRDEVSVLLSRLSEIE